MISLPPIVSASSLARVGVVLVGMAFLCFLHAVPTAAQQTADRASVTNVRPVDPAVMPSPRDICTLHPGPSFDRPPVFKARSTAGKAASATIQVEYIGFSGEARRAFQRAVDIWETHIRSGVTIKIRAEFTPLDPGVLGSAGPNRFWFYPTGSNGEVTSETSIYPDALIDAILGRNAVEDDDDPNNDDAPDMEAQFSSSANWYFGDGTPASGQADFTTVVLHEIGHGLGFFGSMQVSGLQGSWGFGTSDPTVPAIYDRFAEDEDGDELLTEYSNPSPQLANVLTSGDVFFSGPESDVAAAIESGPVPVELYAPSDWDGGSSYSHVDEATYPATDPNALMTPQIGNEVVRQVGPIVCGMFADMGWRLGPGCAAYFDVAVVGFEAEELADRDFQLSWAETRAANIDVYELERQYFEEPPVTQTIPSEGAQRYTVSLSDLDVGDYTFRLSYIRPNGERVFVGETTLTIPLRQSFRLAEIYPNPFSQQANIQLTVRRAQTFRVEVYNALGQQVAVLYDQQRPANDPRPITFDAAQLGSLPSGRYFFRVIGENFEETRSAVFVR